MPFPVLPRRDALLLGVGLLLPVALRAQAQKGTRPDQEKPVGAVEDLMREHGILRRILLVYAEMAPRIERGERNFDAGAIHQAATLFRSFGEDYHEKKLEEENIFPAIRTAVLPLAEMTRILSLQHERGREITDHILGATAEGKIQTGLEKPMAQQLRALVRMYQNHAAREDTILFPAWKKTLTQPELAQISDKFEGIEKQTFGTDGFDDAAKKIDDIEIRLGLHDLGRFTAPAPTLK